MWRCVFCFSANIIAFDWVENYFGAKKDNSAAGEKILDNPNPNPKPDSPRRPNYENVFSLSNEFLTSQFCHLIDWFLVLCMIKLD
jgi:hypothetical protein